MQKREGLEVCRVYAVTASGLSARIKSAGEAFCETFKNLVDSSQVYRTEGLFYSTTLIGSSACGHYATVVIPANLKRNISVFKTKFGLDFIPNSDLFRLCRFYAKIAKFVWRFTSGCRGDAATAFVPSMRGQPVRALLPRRAHLLSLCGRRSFQHFFPPENFSVHTI